MQYLERSALHVHSSTQSGTHLWHQGRSRGGGRGLRTSGVDGGVPRTISSWEKLIRAFFAWLETLTSLPLRGRGCWTPVIDICVRSLLGWEPMKHETIQRHITVASEIMALLSLAKDLLIYATIWGILWSWDTPSLVEDCPSLPMIWDVVVH